MKVVIRLSPPKAAFVYPILPAPRTAVLEPWFKSKRFESGHFRSNAMARVFAEGWCPEAAAYRPAAIAATWRRLYALTGKIEPLTHAIIVLRRAADEPLTTQQRQYLWRAFRVPVFEQVVGSDGALLAAECEAHAGLHIESLEFDPGNRQLETAPCGCGRPGPRLKPAEPADPVRAAAAYGS